jgi:type I restriction enzyme S subunit
VNADRLLVHYERIADAPDAISRLRRFILNLAVRGKLVRQDPSDEPASELLKRIAKEKAPLAKGGKAGKPAPSMLISEFDAQFDLPAGWVWTSIGEICSKTGSGSTPRGGKSAYRKVGIIFLRSQNIYDDGVRLNDVAYIDVATHARMSGTIVRSSDLLLNITGGSIGRCCRFPDDFVEANVSQHVAIIRVAVDGLQDFLHWLILSPYFQAFIFREQTGAGRGGLPKNRMDRIPVALPPLAEQHRIVAKVDEIMALCDRVEATLADTEDIRRRLLKALLAEALALSADVAQEETATVCRA